MVVSSPNVISKFRLKLMIWFNALCPFIEIWPVMNIYYTQHSIFVRQKKQRWLLLRVLKENLFHSYFLPLGTTGNHGLVDASFNLCFHLHVAFSLYLCAFMCLVSLCVSSFSYKDNIHIGWRAHPSSVWPCLDWLHQQ